MDIAIERVGPLEANYSCEECLVEIELSGEQFWITYDDSQCSIQLNSKAPEFNGIVEEVRANSLPAARPSGFWAALFR